MFGSSRRDLYLVLRTVRTARAVPVLTMGENNSLAAGSRQHRYVLGHYDASTRRQPTYVCKNLLTPDVERYRSVSRRARLAG